MKIVESILTNNPCYEAGRKITVKGLMLHSVGCPQPSAQVFVKNWNRTDYDRACVHAFIDANDGTIYKTLPWDHRGWHGGGSSNNTHIGVEMCEPDCIKYTGGASFTCSNAEKAKEMAKRTYEAAVELFAYLCKEFNLDPLADGVIISHKEGHARGIASNHGDPEHLWSQLGMGYTMNTFRQAVSDAMNGDSTNGSQIMYRVQIGAYSNLSYAKACLEKAKAAGFTDAFIATVEKVTEEPTIKEPTVDIEAVAREVIQGKYGNGDVRKQKLVEQYGAETAKAIQDMVNQLLKG